MFCTKGPFSCMDHFLHDFRRFLGAKRGPSPYLVLDSTLSNFEPYFRLLPPEFPPAAIRRGYQWQLRLLIQPQLGSPAERVDQSQHFTNLRQRHVQIHLRS